MSGTVRPTEEESVKKFLVCKSVVPYSQGAVALYLFFPTTGYRTFGSINELANYLLECEEDELTIRVKNEAPCDVMVVRDDTLPKRVVELERLSRDEFRDLVRLLRRA